MHPRLPVDDHEHTLLHVAKIAGMRPSARPEQKQVSSNTILRRLGTLRRGSRSPRKMNDKDALKNEASKTDKRKQSLYFPESMLQEIKEEAARLDRSLSWVVQRAWKLARVEIKKLPSVNDVNENKNDTGE